MIYIAQHNDEQFVPILKGYKILKVGKEFEDDGRDNINYLNPYINEATALYDIWKNCNEEIVGLTHYRRIFIYMDDMDYLRGLSFDIAKKILEYKDIITSPFHTLGSDTIYGYHRYSLLLTSPHTVKTFDKYINKLDKIEPKLIEYFMKSNRFIARNMFVAKKEVIDKYCEWLFPIIIPLTEEFIENDLKNVGPIGKTPGQERLIGHFIERMFSYWVECVYGLDKVGALKYLTYGN